ncbi:MAG: SpoIIE family protein phosphatase [Acidobacteriia bacterium]|nr:SpoIIE family protein phosphatase [Terriglobia bacterium]
MISRRDLLRGIRPTTKFAKASCVVVALYLMVRLAGIFVSVPLGLSIIVNLLFFIVAVRYAFKFLRWSIRKVLWRLRRRLIVTYLLVGVVPVLLLFAIILILATAFFGQLTGLFLTEEISRLSGRLDAADHGVAAILSEEAKKGALSAESFSSSRRSLIENLSTAFPLIWIDTGGILHHSAWQLQSGEVRNRTGATNKPEWANGPTSGVFFDGNNVFLAAISFTGSDSQSGWTLMRVPLDSEVLKRIAEKKQFGITVIELVPSPRATGGAHITFQVGDRTYVQHGIQQVDPEAIRTLTQKLTWYDFPVRFPLFLPQVRDWNSGQRMDVFPRIYLLHSTWMRVAKQLFMAGFGGEDNVIAIALAGVFIFFLLIEFVALVASLIMTRTITGTVHNLDEGAQHIMRGDFSHRIPIKSRDQLSALGETFNSMTASIERLLKEQTEKQKLESELAIALEVQRQLFPREAPRLRGLEIAGLCNPARIVSGDYYDYLLIAPTTLGLALGDVSGKGVSAALLMASLQAALRSHSLYLENHQAGAAVASGDQRSIEGLKPPHRVAQIVSSLNRHLCQNTPSEKYATFFYGVYDEQESLLTYTNAGHWPPLVFGEKGFRRLETGGTVLGLMPEARYDQGSTKLMPGEVFVAFTDGVNEAENIYGEQFGESQLIQVVQGVQGQASDAILEAIIGRVQEWVGSGEPQDDMTLIVARAH